MPNRELEILQALRGGLQGQGVRFGLKTDGRRGHCPSQLVPPNFGLQAHARVSDPGGTDTSGPARKITVILHCIWVDGTSFDGGNMPARLFLQVPGPVRRAGDARWDGGRNDLGQSAGSGSSAPRCKRGGTRSGHHHEALTTSERTIGQLITLKPGDSKSACYYELAIDPPAALAPSAQPRPAPSGRARLLCHMASKKVDNNPQLKSRLAIALILGRSAAVSRLGPIVVAPMTTRI